MREKIKSWVEMICEQKLPDYLKLALQFEKIKKRFLTHNKFGDNLANSSLPRRRSYGFVTQSFHVRGGWMIAWRTRKNVCVGG